MFQYMPEGDGNDKGYENMKKEKEIPEWTCLVRSFRHVWPIVSAMKLVDPQEKHIIHRLA